MSDNMVMHRFSNSSNQSGHSLPIKIAEHEALMVGKPSSAQPQAPWTSSISTTAKFAVATEELPEHSSSSDEDKLMSLRARITTLEEEMRKAPECQKPLHELKQLMEEEYILLRALTTALDQQLEQKLCPRHLKEFKDAEAREEQMKSGMLHSFSLQMTIHSSETAGTVKCSFSDE